MQPYLHIGGNKDGLTHPVPDDAKARLSILDDAMTMSRDAYRDRVERFLRQNGFDL